MDKLSQQLLEEMSTRTLFHIGPVPVTESTVVTWIIMAFLLILSVFLTHNLKIVPTTRKQVVVELIVTKCRDLFIGILGPDGECYVPYLMSVGLYIGVSNLIGLIGLKPPTKDFNITAGLSIMSIILIEAAGIRKKGPLKFIKSFSEPMALITPLNILEIFIKPLSLCMRLFGNILGAFVVMELIKLIAPAFLPIPFSLYFDIFDGLLQTYVFVFLTSLFMKESME